MMFPEPAARLRSLLLITAMLSCFQYTRAQDSHLPLITVTGQAEIRVVPDEVLISWGVETSDRVLSIAKKENDERVARVLALIKSFDVASNHVQTDFIGVEPWYRQGVERPESLEYRVRKTVVVALKDTGKFESLVSKGLEAGVTHIHGIQFRTTDLRKHRDAARALAINAAREKAIALAGQLGQKVGQAHRISEFGSGWFSPYGFGWGHRWGQGMTQNVIQEGGGTASSEGTIALGQITVTASVSVSFLLE